MAPLRACSPFPLSVFRLFGRKPAKSVSRVRDASRSWLPSHMLARAFGVCETREQSERRSAVDKLVPRGRGAREPMLVLLLLKRMVRERAVPPSGQASIACRKLAPRGESQSLACSNQPSPASSSIARALCWRWYGKRIMGAPRSFSLFLLCRTFTAAVWCEPFCGAVGLLNKLLFAKWGAVAVCPLPLASSARLQLLRPACMVPSHMTPMCTWLKSSSYPSSSM